MFKKKYFPIVISAITALGIATPIAKNNANVSICYADTLSDVHDFKYNKTFLKNYIDSYANSINLDNQDAKIIMDEFFATTSKGLPFFEIDEPEYDAEHIRTSSIYLINFAKYIFNEIIPNKVKTSGESCADLQRNFLDKIMQNKDLLIEYYFACGEEDENDLNAFYNYAKEIYFILDDYLKENCDFADPNEYKKYYDSFKERMTNPTEDELYYADGLSFFNDIASLIALSIAPNNYESKCNELRNGFRDNIAKPDFTFDDSYINAYLHKPGFDFFALTEEEKKEFITMHLTDLFMPTFKTASFIVGLFTYNYQNLTTDCDDYICIINEIGPLIYKTLDLLDALIIDDYDNVYMLVEEIIDDVDNFLERFNDDNDFPYLMIDKVTASNKLFFYAEKGKDKYRMLGADNISTLFRDVEIDQINKDQYHQKLKETYNFGANLLSTHIQNNFENKELPELTYSNGLLGFYENDFNSDCLNVLKTTNVDFEIDGKTILSDRISEEALDIYKNEYYEENIYYKNLSADVFYYPIKLSYQIDKTLETVPEYELPMYSFYIGLPENFEVIEVCYVNEYSDLCQFEMHDSNYGFNTMNDVIILDDNQGYIVNCAPNMDEILIKVVRPTTAKMIETFYINENNELVVIYADRDFYGHETEEIIGLVEGPKGDKGDEGKGIKSVSINENNELVVIYTDDTTTVVGKITGKDGADGKDGHTPVITIGDNGNWFIDGVDSGVTAKAKSNGITIGIACGSGAIAIAALVLLLIKRKRIL